MPRSGSSERSQRDGAILDRRSLLALAGATGAAGLMPATVRRVQAASMQSMSVDEAPAPPGVNLQTLIEGEKLARVSYTDAELEQSLRSINDILARYDIVRNADLQNGEGPAEVFDPRLPGMRFAEREQPARFARPPSAPLPTEKEDIAFASVAQLSAWIHERAITSEELTRIYLDRLKQLGPKLECVVTLMEESAIADAQRADRELRAGVDRGPLHGLPWGAKDLFDTAGVRTTWGAAPFRDRVPERDATIVERLNDAGAVLVAKLTLGALAYGDIWFDGKTRNPWNLEQGSSGSSAGSASAVAAGLCAFTIGTETYGSIMSPSARCGAAGFRPTFGRVSRHGAMALCWSLDKVGPICRSAEDCAYVLDAIAGPDPKDESTIDIPLNMDMTRGARGVTIGFLKDEFESDAARPEDQATLAALNDLGAELVPLNLQEDEYGGLIFFLISVEAAAAFDELIRFGGEEQMVWQDDAAWPNTFRTIRFASAVEFMNARRLRRRWMRRAAGLFADVDIVIAPSRHGAMHALTNMTGHPAVTIRQGFRENGTPFAITMWGNLFDDSTLLSVASALEGELGVGSRRPPIA